MITHQNCCSIYLHLLHHRLHNIQSEIALLQFNLKKRPRDLIHNIINTQLTSPNCITRIPMKPQFNLFQSTQSSSLRTYIPTSITKTSKIPLQPSLPIHIHHSKILSIKTPSISKINTQTQYHNPISSTLYGFLNTKFRRFESVVPAEFLVAGNVNKLTLNGLIDWAILPRNGVVGYSGVALIRQLVRLPWKSGLSGFKKLGYVHFSGRGDVYIDSGREIYIVNLEGGEEIVVRKDGIVGVSVNGEELSSCCESIKFGEHEETEVAVVEEKSENELKDLFWNGVGALGKVWKWIVDSIGKDDFIKVKGPRTLILTSDVKTGFQFSKNDIDDIEITEQQIKKSQDYLSYATVRDGKVTFHSTPDFQKTIDKIERE